MKRVKTIVAEADGYKLEVNIKLSKKNAWADNFAKDWDKSFDNLVNAVAMDYHFQDIKIK